MSKVIYRIAERQTFMKYVKKYDRWEKPIVSYDYVMNVFESEHEANAYLVEKEANLFPYGNINGAHYEKIDENLFKLTYENTKNFRYLSYDICKFIIPEEEETWTKK